MQNGALWPMPVTLDVDESFVSQLKPGETILLVNSENTPLARMTVSSNWKPDKTVEAEQVFGTTDRLHPAVDYLFNEAGAWYLGGKLAALNPLVHYDFIEYRHTPAQLKQLFQLYGWSRVVAFQTRNPVHRAHFELTRRAAKAANAALLIHPVVGMTKPGDIDGVTRVKCYEQILTQYPVEQPVMLSLLPLAMRMGGPREAIWHAIIRKNYGATHFIVGRDHAGPGVNGQGQPFYDPFAAQQQLACLADELGLEIMAFPEVVHVREKATFLTTDELTSTDTVENISGTDLRNRLEKRLDIPDWFSFPEVIKTLQNAYPQKQQQGFTLFFTGLSGAGKSTLAKAVQARILEANQRAVTLLDGDEVRKQLSSGLGFSKADRDANIQRLGFVAGEITRHKGIVIIAAIAPYAAARQSVRSLVSTCGGFIEVYVATSVEVCKGRDVKGLYHKAEQGLITGFTGVNDPYEPPENAEVIIDTAQDSVSEAVNKILSVIEEMGFSWRNG